jgi:hypothetical protein
MTGRPWDTSPVPRMTRVVESIKMIVVIPTKNMCPRDPDKGPLELQDGEKSKA